MADKKKRLCPNVVLGQDKKPRCGKEFEFDSEEGVGRCPHCGFNVARYDDERALREVEDFERKAAEPPPKKKSILGNL